MGRSADVLETPAKGLHATIVIDAPTALFVAVDATREPVHGTKLTVHSLLSIAAKTKTQRKEFAKRALRKEQTVRNEALRRSARLRQADDCGTLRIEARGNRAHLS